MSVCTSRCEAMACVTQDDIAALDRRIVLAAQAGLPLEARPYHWLADELGVDPETLMQRLRVMQADGRIRRIGVVPNHYRLGYTANAMTVWDVADADIREVGRQVGELDIVSHCYQRPRRPPDWPGRSAPPWIAISGWFSLSSAPELRARAAPATSCKNLRRRKAASTV